jgi:peptidyl-prolyl cis-trans isomerase SurA
LNANYFSNSWKLPIDFTGNKNLLSIGNRAFHYKDFGDYLLKTMRSSRQNMDYKVLVKNKYDAFLSESLITYQEDNLENENEEFANIVAEYRDGLLLFELMENTIWNTAISDSLGVKTYYEAHKADYVLPESIDAVVATSAKQKTLKKVAKLLGKGVELDQIKSLVNSNNQIEVIFTSGVMDADHQALPENFEFEKGISKIFKHNEAYVLVQVKDILPSSQKSFEESKGAVISDYQTYKEEKWVKELESKYEIDINEAVFTQVKAQLK